MLHHGLFWNNCFVHCRIFLCALHTLVSQCNAKLIIISLFWSFADLPSPDSEAGSKTAKLYILLQYLFEIFDGIFFANSNFTQMRLFFYLSHLTVLLSLQILFRDFSHALFHTQLYLLALAVMFVPSMYT